MQHEGRWINKRRWNLVYRLTDCACAICGEMMPIELTCPCCDAEMCEGCAEGHWCPEPKPERRIEDALLFFCGVAVGALAIVLCLSIV